MLLLKPEFQIKPNIFNPPTRHDNWVTPSIQCNHAASLYRCWSPSDSYMLFFPHVTLFKPCYIICKWPGLCPNMLVWTLYGFSCSVFWLQRFSRSFPRLENKTLFKATLVWDNSFMAQGAAWKLREHEGWKWSWCVVKSWGKERADVWCLVGEFLLFLGRINHYPNPVVTLLISMFVWSTNKS